MIMDSKEGPRIILLLIDSKLADVYDIIDYHGLRVISILFSVV